MNSNQENYNQAHKKMILGIIFVAVAAVLSFISLALVSAGMYDDTSLILGIFFLLGCFALYGVGIPFMIKGIKGSAKYSKLLNQERQAQDMARYAAQQQAPQYQSAQPAYQPAPQQPVYQPAQAAPVYQSAAPQPVYQPAPETAPERTMPQQPAAPVAANGFVDIDIWKYNPIDSGVSMKMDKDYKFHRADGFVGSVPQKFVDRTFVKCPICCTNQPNWTIAQHNQMSWKGNLYLFKCSCCDGVVSMSMPDVTTLGNGGGGIAANPNVGLTNLIAKKSSGKDATAVYAVIESVGRSGVNPVCQGKEIKLEDMQQLSMRM